MKKIFYEKVGRRYVPVAEYDNELLDSFPKGNHLVMCYPGGSSRRFNVDPALAPMIAAGRYAEQPMHDALRKASEMHRSKYENTILTEEQHAVWEQFVKLMGERGRYVQWSSIHDIAEAGIKAMEEEAERLMQHESVRKAYDHFMLMCKLVKQNELEQSF